MTEYNAGAVTYLIEFIQFTARDDEGCMSVG